MARFIDAVKNDRLRIAGILNDRVLVGPEKVSFHLTNVCNLKCIHCWRYSPLNADRPIDLDKQELDLDHFKKIIDDCCRLGVRRIQFSARGETTLHRRILEMVDYVKDKGLFLTVLTNGTFGKKVRSGIKRADEIKVDLSATTREQYQKVQSPCAGHLFNRVLENLAFLTSLKKSSRRPPLVKINFILSAHNRDSLKDIFRLALRLKVDHLNILTVSVNKYTRSILLTQPMVRQAEKTCHEMLREGLLAKVPNNLLVNYQATGDFFNRTAAAKKCYNSWYHIFVAFNGDVAVCCKTRDFLVAGNIYDDPLWKIWGSEKFHSIRLAGKRDLWGGKFDKCRKCCFYKFNHSLSERLKRVQKGLL